MDALIGPIVLVVIGCLVAGPILGILALARVNRLTRYRGLDGDEQDRLDSLEARLAALHRRTVALEKAAAAPSPQAAAPPAPSGRVATADRGETPLPAAPPPVPPSTRMPPLQRPPDLDGAAEPPLRAGPHPPEDFARHPAPPPPLEPPRPPSPPIDWERFIGIRGAALVGAVALGLAGLLFFKYSIEKGLITPAMRVVLGTLTGLACLGGSEWLRGRRYRQTAEAIAGAGVVILYAAFWAAHVLYRLVPMGVVFALMVLVTAACCLLAVRHGSLVVAVLGLIGGFATPLLLSSGSDRPIGLFGYILLLDVGLLAVGHKRRWPSLGVLSLLATVLLQGLWIVARMGPARLFLGLIILAVFALLFVAAGRFAGSRDARPGWLWSQVGAILFPFAFALYFAARVGLGPHLYPIAILMALLGAGAGFVARERRVHALSAGTATATVAVTAVWLMQHRLTTPLAWETVAAAAGLALVYHLFVERDRDEAGADGPAPAALIASGGLFVLLLFACGGSAGVPVAPWLCGFAALAAILYRHAAFPGRAAVQPAAALGIGAGLSILHLAHHRHPLFPAPGLFVALLIAAALALQVVAWLRRDGDTRRFADHAAALLPVALLLGFAPSPLSLSQAPLPAPGGALLLGILALVAATRLGAGAWCAAATGATLVAHVAWISGRAGLRDRPSECLAAFVLLALAVAVFTLWPLLAARRFSGDRLAWYAAALAGPLWFDSLRRLFVFNFGDAFIGVLPVGLGALSLLAADRARRAWPAADPIRKTALVWFAAVALCFVAVAIPLQLEKEWITIGWALEGLAVIALWRRLDHPGLKWFGLALLGATTIRLIANAEIFGYHPRPAMRIVNWLMYTYLVPAAAMLLSAALLKPLEAERARPWEAGAYRRGHAAGAIGAGLAAIVVVFAWINLAIADWFAAGDTLALDLGGPPAQRLTVSIAWGLYALLLLGFGMARDTLGLRWLSLCFLLVTIGKVFLYDLGSLRDLYRVASLVGLAVSLILVSLLYQRFVFRKSRAGAS